MHHTISAATSAVITVTKPRVAVFEIVKHKSSNAMENITILRRESRTRYEPKVIPGRREMTYDHISKAYGRLRIMAIGSRPNVL
jgi:hypothetical protein